jgi:hypothetical protein
LPAGVPWSVGLGVGVREGGERREPAKVGAGETATEEGTAERRATGRRVEAEHPRRGKEPEGFMRFEQATCRRPNVELTGAAQLYRAASG